MASATGLLGWMRERSDVEKVGLFGSYATDTYGPRSDADLLIVLRSADKPFPRQNPQFSTVSPSPAMCSPTPPPNSTASSRTAGSPWITHILKEVVWL